MAKIEAGERAARIDELVAIADIFGVSVDGLLGHSVDQVDDEAFAVRALMETARHARWQTESTEATLRRQISDLAAFNPRGREKAVQAACQEACDALAAAAEAIRKADSPMSKIQSDMLRAMFEQRRDEFLEQEPKEGDRK